jgi:GNAT superfamily N-acetyltransferase
VVVRRIVGVRGNRPLFSDALGELVNIDGTGLTVATRKGPIRVPLPEVHAAKRVPERRRPAAREVAALELVANAAWPAPRVDRLGDWLLRAADGWTGRANSALPIGDPGVGLADAIDAVRAWYAERGLPARINVPLPLAARVDGALDGRGWARSRPTLVQTAPLPTVVAAAPHRPDLPAVELAPRPDPAWLAMVAARKGELPEAAHQVLTGPPEVRYAAVHDDVLVAIARGALVDGYLHVGLLEVTERARRRGMGGHVTGALARWAAQCGAHTALLQVEEHNAPAIALYARLGFATHHTYVTRTLSS